MSEHKAYTKESVQEFIGKSVLLNFTNPDECLRSTLFPDNKVLVVIKRAEDDCLECNYYYPGHGYVSFVMSYDKIVPGSITHLPYTLETVKPFRGKSVVLLWKVGSSFEPWHVEGFLDPKIEFPQGPLEECIRLCKGAFRDRIPAERACFFSILQIPLREIVPGSIQVDKKEEPNKV